MFLYYLSFLTIRVEFVPPNPNELLKKVSNSTSTLSCGILIQAEASSGSSKFRLAAMKLFCIISIEYTISLAPAIHISCPVKDLVEATSDASSMLVYSNALRTLCTNLCKVCNDLRLMSSGPRCGLGEIKLPALQPGSSIMPGKVNPVIPEVVNQICYRVIGNDTCIMLGANNAQLELNVMEPVMVYSLLESIELLTNGFDVLRKLCIDGITANKEHCREMVDNSIGTITALVPVLGYKTCSKLAKEALETGRSVYDLVLEHGILTKEELDTILSPENMIKPVKLDIKPRK